MAKVKRKKKWRNCEPWKFIPPFPWTRRSDSVLFFSSPLPSHAIPHLPSSSFPFLPCPVSLSPLPYLPLQFADLFFLPVWCKLNLNLFNSKSQRFCFVVAFVIVDSFSVSVALGFGRGSWSPNTYQIQHKNCGSKQHLFICSLYHVQWYNQRKPFGERMFMWRAMYCWFFLLKQPLFRNLALYRWLWVAHKRRKAEKQDLPHVWFVASGASSFRFA